MDTCIAQPPLWDATVLCSAFSNTLQIVAVLQEIMLFTVCHSNQALSLLLLISKFGPPSCATLTCNISGPRRFRSHSSSTIPDEPQPFTGSFAVIYGRTASRSTTRVAFVCIHSKPHSFRMPERWSEIWRHAGVGMTQSSIVARIHAVFPSHILCGCVALKYLPSSLWF